MNNKAAIIIVNWNGVKFLKDCLESVYNQSYQNFDVYFVDNGSIDESVEFVRKNFPKTKIIELDHNTGFAKGNNIGISKAFHDSEIKHIITLNNDTKVDKYFLENLIKITEIDKNIGCVVPKVRFFYEENLIDSVGILIYSDGGGTNRGHREIDNRQYDKAEEVFGACAGAALYTRKMLEDIKYKNEFFDNLFFAYYEDLDLAWRARLKGWKSVSCPKAIVYHIHSATCISYSPFKAFHVNRNRFFVIIKNFSFEYFLKAFFLTPMRYLRLLNSIRIKKGPSYKLKEKTNIFAPFLIVLKGWISVLWNLPKILAKRHYIQKNKKVSNKKIKEWFDKFSANMEDMIYK